MKRILMIMMTVLIYGTAMTGEVLPPEQKAAPKKAPATKAATKAAVVPKQKAETEVPAGAKEIEPDTFRWVDPKGVAWIYRKTPFGLMKHQETKEVSKPEPVPTDWIVADKDDSLVFTRPWPFGGSQTWTKKKNDLSDLEKAVWDRSKTVAK